jgi:histidinol-phosphate/aromatic aminotransferase/cobyric acid decarboxylase-like protein
MDDSRFSGKVGTASEMSQQESNEMSIKNAMAAQAALENKKGVEEYRRKLKERAEQENQNLWQHPYVDVFKHFKVMPCDWK